MKWLKQAIARERRALERARRQFLREPNEKRLHAVRTAGRRFRSLLQDVASIAGSKRLRRRVKRAATATDSARDAAVIAGLLERCVHTGEAHLVDELLRHLRERERFATQRACRELRRLRFDRTS
jgi:hypothetical protein